MKKFKVFQILIFVIGFLLAVIYAFDQGYFRFNYPSQSQFPIRGIDVSHHQSDIDWQEVRNQGIEFAFIKATEGGDFKDPDFEKNRLLAKQAGLKIGAYHFFTFCRTGIEQANNFNDVVPREATFLPPVVDLEFGGNCDKNLSPEELFYELNSFTAILEEHFGQKPIYYTTQAFYEKYLTQKTFSNPLWIRNIFRKPRPKQIHTWTFWQYANRGRVRGIHGPVDLNVFHGTQDEWKRYTVKTR